MSESGVVNITGKVDIYSPTNGIVDKVLVANEQVVKEGEELFTVKSTATDQEKQAAYSNYLSAKSALDSASATQYSLQAEMFSKWDKFKELAESDDYETSDGKPKYEQRGLPEFHIPEKEWLAAEAQYKNQQTVIAQTRALVNSTWLLYQATQNATVKSPISGKIANLSIIPGGTIFIYSPLSSTTPALTIGNFTKMEVVIPVTEDDINKLKVGQRATIEVDAARDKAYQGSVVRTDAVGTIASGVVRYNAYVEITNPDNSLLSGMSADAHIVTKQYRDVLTVSNSSIKPYQGKKAVRVPGKNKNDIKFIPVQLGVRGDKKTQIVKGLSEGQIIITTLLKEEVKQSNLLGF